MDQYTIYEIEEFGIEDGSFDKDNKMPYMSSYGSSVDITDLSDEQLEAYKSGYDTGAEDYDLCDDDDDEEDDYDRDCAGFLRFSTAQSLKNIGDKSLILKASPPAPPEKTRQKHENHFATNSC